MTRRFVVTYVYLPEDAVSAKVTFKVVNGAWDDGTTEAKTVTLTGYEGDTLKLTEEQIPAAGNKPNKDYKAGSWDVTPDTETAIAGDTTYTYTYYTLTYSKKLVNPGKWRVKVTGKGNFKGSKKLAFKVFLPKIKNMSLTSGKTEIVVKWSQEAKIGRCQIQVSQKKDFSDKISKKFRISEKTEKHAKTVKGLQPGMKYYVRIRTYKTVGKKTYYSDWSPVKTVRTKSAVQNNAQARPVEMAVGEVLDLNALLTRAEIEAVRSWSSDDAEIAAVTPDGVVTAMQAGEAAVTATLEDGEEIEFSIIVREDGIVLLNLAEDDLTLDLDEDVLGDGMDVEANLEIEE